MFLNIHKYKHIHIHTITECFQLLTPSRYGMLYMTLNYFLLFFQHNNAFWKFLKVNGYISSLILFNGYIISHLVDVQYFFNYSSIDGITGAPQKVLQ